MAPVPLAIRTLFADLLQRGLDAEFDEEFPPAGDFQKKKRGNRYYWYYREGGREGQKSTPKYVGPVTDASVTDRVRRFAALKSDFSPLPVKSCHFAHGIRHASAGMRPYSVI